MRGRSETIWRFTTERDGQTSIHLETLVDPRGNVPTWVVDKLGKSAAVTIVRSLIKHTLARERRRKARGDDADDDGSSWWRPFSLMRARNWMWSVMSSPARFFGFAL